MSKREGLWLVARPGRQHMIVLFVKWVGAAACAVERHSPGIALQPCAGAVDVLTCSVTKQLS